MLAHAKQALLGVLHSEALVSELSIKCRKLVSFVFYDCQLFTSLFTFCLYVTSLHEHALDHPAELGADIADLLAVFLDALAKLLEVLACLRANVFKELDENHLGR